MSKKLSRLIMTSIAIFKIIYAKSGYQDSIDIHIPLSNIKLSKMVIYGLMPLFILNFRFNMYQFSVIFLLKTYINLSH